MTATKTVRRYLCTAILSATAIIAAVCEGAAPPPAAEIISIEGKGEYREPQQIDWRPAVVKQAVFPSYFVRTGDLSKMALLFADRTQILGR